MEEVILSAKLDQVEFNKGLDELYAKQTQLETETKSLIEQQKTLKKLNMDSGEVYSELTKEISDNKQKLKETNDQIKIQTAVQNANSNSMEKAVAANKALRAERDKIDASTKEGSARIKELNRQIDANTEFIKENTSNYEKQKMNIGNYTGAFDKLVPVLGEVKGGVESANVAMKAMVANPIGLFISTLVLSIAALTQYFRDNEEGQNKFNKLMNIGTAIVGKFTDYLSYLGEQVFDRVAKGLETTFNFLAKWVPGFEAATAAVSKYLNLDRADLISKLQAENDVLERQLIVQREVLGAKIAELKLRSEDKSLDAQTRIKILQDAKKAQEELSALESKFAENKLKIAQENNKQSNSNKEALKEEAEAEAELFKIKKDAADKQKEIFTKTQEITASAKAAQDTTNAQLSEEARLRRINNLEREQSLNLTELQKLSNATELEANKALEESLVEVKKNGIKAITDYQKEMDAKLLEDKKNRAEQEKIIEANKNQAIAGGILLLTKNQMGARAALSAVFKQDAIKETWINTRAAATAAYKSMAGIPIVGPALGTVAAGIAYAYGASQVAGILGINFSAITAGKFAQGGKVVNIGGKSHAFGGTKFYGEDGTTFEAERGESLYVLKKSANAALIKSLSDLNVAHGGNSWYGSKMSYAEQGGRVYSPEMSKPDTSSPIIVNAQVSVVDILTAVDRRVEVVERATMF